MNLVENLSEINHLSVNTPTSMLTQDLIIDSSNHLTAPSAYLASVPAPASEETTIENQEREPLKDISKQAKGNSEVADQEQEQEESPSNEGGVEKINDYVAKVLEKIVKQRNKVAKLSALMEKKGLVVDKKGLQIGALSQEFEEIVANTLGKDALLMDKEDDENTPISKENLSPEKRKQITLRGSNTDEKKQHADSSPLKIVPKYQVQDVLQISRKEISYGYRFPGQIVEEDFEVINKSGQDFVVQIFVSCLNEELVDTDEYVYSVRRSHLYDYNDKHFLIMAPYSSASFKFALKVPNTKSFDKILGEVKISIQGLPGSYLLKLEAGVSIPKIYCPKELRCNGLEYPVIKLAVKEGKKQECKIPIRNNGNVPVTLELDFYEPKVENRQKGQRAFFDCMVHPNTITIAPNSQTLTNILIKPWKILSVVKYSEKQKPVRKILVGKVRDSALVYSFVFWIEVY